MNDLGKVTNILGISVERRGDTGPIKLSQHKYIKESLEKFGMENCKPVGTPLIPNETLNAVSTDMEDMTNVPYRELVGTLIYLSNATRPDVAHAANVLSQFNENPSNYHWKAAKHVLRYLKGTINHSIKYSAQNKPLEVYVDSDWAADENGRRSRTGYITMLAGGPISWESRKQKSVALSTMEAEYMALSEATKEAIYLKRLLANMNFNNLVCDKTSIFCDNQSAIHLSKDNVYHRRSKHIDIRYHYTREMRENGEIDTQYISTNEMIADMLTKSLPKVKLEKCVDLLNLRK
ncbi:Retrovirus-related Pol polyprotein from transposon TNT 1-94 [Anthophora plagiata]